MRWGKIGAAVAVSMLAVSNVAHAAEILFRTPGADRDLRGALASSSLLIQARNDNSEDPQELVAAARADYSRLLGALYDAGRFGGVISILVDGREAAAIPPLAAPAEITRIQIEVNPGPLFRFSDATVLPLPPGTELPEEFAVGRPARTGVIREAATVAIDSWRLEGHAKARVSDQRIVARHDGNQLSARLTVEPGPALRFGEVTV
ncbi:MAG: autotransporter assembly complex protein TamA, partial [Boseongicola sp.]